MKIYLICPVRNAAPEVTKQMEAYVAGLEGQGHQVHFPPRDVNQGDPDGFEICRSHLAAMKECDEVHVYWDPNSKGSHFDLGMAFALGKLVDLAYQFEPDIPGKSYVKVMKKMGGGDYARDAKKSAPLPPLKP
jgi:hypothetical protein